MGAAYPSSPTIHRRPRSPSPPKLYVLIILSLSNFARFAHPAHSTHLLCSTYSLLCDFFLLTCRRTTKSLRTSRDENVELPFMEDPVTYFARNPDGPIKFVYLNKVHLFKSKTANNCSNLLLAAAVGTHTQSDCRKSIQAENGALQGH